MRCFNCTREVPNNETFRQLDNADFDDVVDWFSLIHIDGDDDQFEEDGTVVICNDCVHLALTS